jgi:hypothetical protein
MTVAVASQRPENLAREGVLGNGRDGASALRADERLWLAGISIVALASWGRWLATGSLKVDESYPAELPGTLLLVALVAGYGLALFGWKGLLERPVQNPRRLAFAGLGVAALMLPMLSNDVYSLLAYGSLAAHGQDVYATSSVLPDSAWYPWVGARWLQNVCVYGPTTLVSVIPASLLHAHPLLALLALRATWFVPLAVVMELSFRHLQGRPFFHAMVWLNPLFLLEGPGQLHTDLLGVVAITAGILFQLRGRLKTGWVMYGVALLGKYSFGLTGPWFWLSGAQTNRQRALRIPAMVALLVPLAVGCFVPFWRGIGTIVEPLRALATMNPGGTLTEVVGHAVHVARGGSLVPPNLPIAEALALDRATHETIWLIASCVLSSVALAVGVRVLRAMLRRTDEDMIALGTGVLIVLTATVASRRFEPWYLLPALPFFGLRCTDEWRRWWIAVAALSVAPTFMNVLPRSALVLPLWSVVTNLGLMAVFLSSFRSRYLGFGQEGIDVAEERSPAVLGVGEGFESALGE